VFFRLAENAVLIVATIGSMVVLRLLTNKGHAQAFEPVQLQSLSSLAIGIQGIGMSFGFILLGLGSTVFSWLLLKSRYVPKAIAVWGIFASLLLSAGALGIIAFPRLRVIGMAYMAPMGLYEVGLGSVLDWELSHIGDPMRDLGWLCTRSWRFGVPQKPVGGFGEYDELIKGYESIAKQKVDRDVLKFWEVFGSFWWAVGCLSMAQSWRDGSEPSVERPAIGRRSSECQIDCVNLFIPGWARQPDGTARTLSATGLPLTGELLTATRDFLRNEAAPALEGRNAFLARVAANSVDVVLRELQFGADAAAWEQQALRGLLDTTGSTAYLRSKLCAAIRLGEVDLKRHDLHAYLRDSVLAQVLIDQPGYPGAAECMSRS
jgi:hypothetical protein